LDDELEESRLLNYGRNADVRNSEEDRVDDDETLSGRVREG